MDVRAAIKGQYHAVLATLRQAIEQCPPQLWTAGEHPRAFWRIAYHAVFYTHLYMVQREKEFVAWEHHRDEAHFVDRLPWPPHDWPPEVEPYTPRQVLEYLAQVDAMVDATVDALDLETDDSGFWWYTMPKLDHELMNIRHTEHHAAQLGERLTLAGLDGLDWIGRR